MTHGQTDVIRPIVVDTPPLDTSLDERLLHSAMDKLRDDTAKMAHFEPRQRARLLEYVEELEAKVIRLSMKVEARADYVANLETIVEAAAKLMFDYRGSYVDNEAALLDLLTVHSGKLSEAEK